VTIAEHVAIRDAIAARDASRARSAMRDHLDGASGRLNLELTVP
jgi:DNA-binding FadR family transcriptional regulator